MPDVGRGQPGVDRVRVELAARLVVVERDGVALARRDAQPVALGRERARGGERGVVRRGRRRRLAAAFAAAFAFAAAAFAAAAFASSAFGAAAAGRVGEREPRRAAP